MGIVIIHPSNISILILIRFDLIQITQLPYFQRGKVEKDLCHRDKILPNSWALTYPSTTRSCVETLQLYRPAEFSSKFLILKTISLFWCLAKH